MKNKLKKIIVCLATMCVILFLNFGVPAYADYGDFESYDSDYDSGSSWDDDDDDWSSSSSTSSYSSSSSSSDGGGFSVVAFIVIIVLFMMFRKNGGDINTTSTQKNPFDLENEKRVLDEIMQSDSLFNKEDFVSWSSDLFVKMQYAWSARDLETLRSFETPEFYEQSATQINSYIQNKRINKIERVSVNICKLYEFHQSGDKESLSVILKSNMVDYIVDETTGDVIKGDKDTHRENTYILTFVRAKGSKTHSDGSKTKTTNCPNCGAPTTITSSGKCEYCGSVITIDSHDNWSLASLKKYNPNM